MNLVVHVDNSSILAQQCSSEMPLIKRQSLDIFINDEEMEFATSLKLPPNLMQISNHNKADLKIISPSNIEKNPEKTLSSNSLSCLSQEESNNIILKLVSECESYKEKLRIAKSAIISRDGHIERMK